MSNPVVVSLKKPELKIIKQAATILQQGGLVAFPTETVYGLGANALESSAIKKIFLAKGRPSDNPLIIHIAEIEDLNQVAKNVSDTAKSLMQAFWPGPLTFVLKKTAIVPKEVTGGLQTVAVRMPRHLIARELIKAAGFPIAAPSANLAGKPSPTTAAHVFEDFGDIVELILDGGKTDIGLESTVIDVTREKVIILRSGQISSKDLAKHLGYEPEMATQMKNKKVRSPGMKYRHYAPQVPLVLIQAKSSLEQIKILQAKIIQLSNKNLRVGIICPEEHQQKYSGVSKIVCCGSLNNISTVAEKLFLSLRSFKAEEVDVILAEGFEKNGIGIAIMDRLERAASEIITE